MTERDDVTGLPNLLTITGRVAPVRSRRPTYLDMLPLCNAGCPAGENIQEWLRPIRVGQHETAWQQFTADNPFPAIYGCICYHPCEITYSRKDLDVVVSIHSVEHYLGDLALECGWWSEMSSRGSGRRMLIIGAGPSGPSAAYHLCHLGHGVEIHDSADAPDGMMCYGIPEYRLLRDALDAEVARIISTGVVIRNSTPVTDLLATRVAGRFDTMFVAIGAHLSEHVDIPSVNATRMVDAVSFLRDVARGERLVIGRQAAVYGSGDTATDAAHVTHRLGAEESVIVYRRTVERIPAHTKERESAEQEGVKMNWLWTTTEMGEKDSTVEIMELDEEDRAYGTGRFEKLAADAVILAIGQRADTGFLHAISGMILDRDVVRVDPGTLVTNVSGIFAGGDMMPSECTVTVGVGHGKETARRIDKWLNLDVAPHNPKHSLVRLGQVDLQCFGGHTRRVQAEQALKVYVSDSGEIVAGPSPKETEFEAWRRLSCDNRFECDGCYSAYPKDAIAKFGPDNRYRFDYERCTGCVICYEQCPVHTIEMIPEGQR